MGDVVRLNCMTTLPISPDDVLIGAVGKLDYCLLIGWSKDGELHTASSEGDLERAVFMATKFIHKVHRGDYG